VSNVADLPTEAFTGFERPEEPTRPMRVLQALWHFLRSKKVGAFSLVLCIVILGLGVIGPYVTPYDKDEVFYRDNPKYDPDSFEKDALQPTTLQRLESPSLDHPLGTDDLGRDLFTRVLFGAQRSMQFGFGAAFLSTVLGALIGIISGYFGGLVDLVFQRIVDAMIAIPGLLFLLLLVQTGETTVLRVIIALSFLGAFGVSRVVRSATLTIRTSVFIEAARVVGVQPPRIIFRHILPNVMAPIIVIFSITIGSSILAEAGLSFLNLGAPGPSWGQMVNTGRQFFDTNPIMSLVGGGAITLTVLAFNIFGDALRDVLDPRLRGA
jgi:peptide/nickel transport system permease protein